MLLRLAVLAGVVTLAFAGWATWRRIPRGLSRLDLADLGLTGPLIVQFSTAYCGPCKRNLGALEAAGEDASVPVAEVDVGARPEVARRYGIRTTPTIVVAGHDGRVLGAWTSLPGNGEIGDAARLAVAAAGTGRP